MKTSFLLLVVIILFSCVNNTTEEEKAEIINLLEKETHYAANADIDNWSSCWVNNNEVSFINTDIDGSQYYFGFKTIEDLISKGKPFDLKLTQDNYHFVIGKDMAFVSYNQTDNWGGGGERNTKETRTLKKVNGKWKIVNTSVVNVSSFEKPHSESFHLQANELPKDPKTGLTHISGVAGISIGYVNVPRPVDFSPLLKGLPHDMCNSPHWGYVIDGSMKVIYADGKEGTFKKGDVYYMPAPHTSVIEKSVKFVDFSPDKEYSILMEQIAKNLAAAKKTD